MTQMGLARTFLCALVCSAAHGARAGNGGAELVSVAPTQALLECTRYETVAVDISVRGRIDNPYDPDEVAIDGVLTAPSGAELMVPAFYWEGFERALVDGEEQLTPTGESGWRFRLTPVEAGDYTYSLRSSGAAGTAEWTGGRIRVAEGAAHGFLRVCRTNNRYFAFDDGTPYFAIGHSVCWPNATCTYDYEEYFATMEAARENYTRLWLGPGWNPFSIQHHAPPDATLTRFDQHAAWRLDYVLNLAEQHGISVMLCIESFNYLRRTDPYPDWPNTPYRADVGGPITEPGGFFTNEEARKRFKARLRYLVARYAHSTHVLSWEFWNEVDLCEGYTSPAVAGWHREMATYLRGLDPYDHLITTSYASTNGDPVVDGLPELDYAQSHYYGGADLVDLMGHHAKKHVTYDRPHMFGEFGADAYAGWLNEDAQGYDLHEGIWASTMSGDCGCAALWWWDNYIRPRNLYYHFTGLARFIEGAPFADPGFGPLDLAGTGGGALKVLGLGNSGCAYVWVRNAAAGWRRIVAEKQTPAPTQPQAVRLTGLAAGRYMVEHFDTWTGEVTRTETVDAGGDGLEITIPPVEIDAAVRLRKAE